MQTEEPKTDTELEYRFVAFSTTPDKYQAKINSIEKSNPGMNIYHRVDTVMPTEVQKPVGLKIETIQTQPVVIYIHHCILYITVPKPIINAH